MNEDRDIRLFQDWGFDLLKCVSSFYLTPYGPNTFQIRQLRW